MKTGDGADVERSKLPWLGGLLGLLVGVILVFRGGPVREPLGTQTTAVLGDSAGSSGDPDRISAADAIQNLAGAYLDDGNAQKAADTIRILTTPADRHRVFKKLFDTYHAGYGDHEGLVDRVGKAKQARSVISNAPQSEADPDANVPPSAALSQDARAVTSTEKLLAELKLLRAFVDECDDTRLKTRCLAKLAETRLDIEDSLQSPTRAELVMSAESLARQMDQSQVDVDTGHNSFWNWLLLVAIPAVTGLIGTAMVKLTESFVSEVGKSFSKFVVTAKEEKEEPAADKRQDAPPGE